MHVQPIVNAIREALLSTSGISSTDPTVEAAVGQLVESLGPALRVAALDLAEQAASEVRAQLPDHTVEIVLAEGDPSLRISEGPAASSHRTADEEFDARITLRLPPSLKDLIEDAAGITGESVNAWVVDALGKRARGSRRADKNYNQSFDL
jgi:Protein of unknown function (DUF1778)